MDEKAKSDRAAETPSPSEAEVVQAMVEIEKASRSTLGGRVESSSPAPSQAWLSSNAGAAVCIGLAFVVVLLMVWGAERGIKELISSSVRGTSGSATTLRAGTDRKLQKQAESVLAQLAAGDHAAVMQVLKQSAEWTGKTQTTPKTEQFLTSALNSNDMVVRAASLDASLALNGVPRNQSGFNQLEEQAGDPRQRDFALWMLGALGNRGIEPSQAAKIIESYLTDPNVDVRSNAVIGDELLGTNETIPFLLDRFRNDPSPAVQELAACGLSQSGMYSHQQRMVAAKSLVAWIDDPTLNQQQRSWIAEALRDISGQSYGMNSAAWRRWYDGAQ